MITLARLACLLGLLLSLCFAPTTVASAATGGCPDPTVSLLQVDAHCEWSQADYAGITANEAHEWTTEPVCEAGGTALCVEFLSCTQDGVTAWMYQIFMDGVPVGQVCLPEDVAEDPPMRVLVERAFRDLDWAASDVVVEPPGGKTLVNLETNFYTSNTGVRMNSVRLRRRDVRVQAEPISYTWHFGDGRKATTTSPGAPYPNLDVAHVYEQVDEVVVSVDTTYANASFSVDGGDWETIDSTLVVPGAEAELEILEAKPQLVIR